MKESSKVGLSETQAESDGAASPRESTDEYRTPISEFLTKDALLRARLAKERSEASSLAAELRLQPALRRKWLVRNFQRFKAYALAEHLLDLAWNLWHSDPGSAEDLSQVALEIAEQLDEKVYGAALINDLRAKAWAWIANSRRVSSNLRGVEEAFRAADFFLAKGSGDPSERAAILSLVAALRRSQRRSSEAAALLDTAETIHRESGDQSKEAQVLIQKAIYLNLPEQGEQAIQLIRQALKLLRDQTEPRLLFYAHHNLIVFQNAVGKTEEALEHLGVVRQLANEVGGTLDEINIELVQGRVLANAGQTEEAEKALRHARNRFIEEGMGFLAAEATLDLAKLYVSTGCKEEARELATDLLPVFRFGDMHRGVLPALLYLQKALREEKATLPMLAEIFGFLEEAEANPSARFEASADLE